MFVSHRYQEAIDAVYGAGILGSSPGFCVLPPEEPSIGQEHAQQADRLSRNLLGLYNCGGGEYF